MRWVLRGIGIVVFVGIAMLAAILLLPGDRIAKIAADRISAATGREVTLSGETRISLYPILGISTGAITVANAPWAGETPLFRADSLKVGVAANAFWGGDIKITGLEAVAPEINLRRNAAGEVNWELGVEGVAPSGQTEPDQIETGETADLPQSRRLALTLDRALIKNATLAYSDAQSGVDLRQTGVDFDLRWPDFDGTATFELVLRPVSEPVTLSGELERVGDFIDGKLSHLRATLTAPSGRLSFDGNVRAAPEAQGALGLDITNTPEFFAALGLSDPGLPAGLGRSSIGLDGDVTLTAAQVVSLREGTLRLDGNTLTTKADGDLAAEPPNLTLQLNTGALDLSGLSGDGTAGGGAGGTAADGGAPESTPAQGNGWSTAPIDASGLAAVNGAFALVADSIDLGDLTLGKTRIMANLDRSRLVFDLREVAAYDGLITGEFVINNRSGLSVGGQLAAQGIDLQTFLTEALDVSRLSGQANGRVSFLGVGENMNAIMNSLSGDGGFETGRGVISGIDLDRIMRGGSVGGGTTVFDSLNATFTMNAGQLYNEDLSLSLPLASASGAGRVGLGPRDIDYTFTPRLLDNSGLGGLAIPVNIRGPWANPSIKPDLEAAIDLNLAAEREALEQKAREEVDKALQEELGLEVQEGQSLEDAAQDALKNELEKGLRGLFD
ncbi:MAG: AsmA family protein [Pseudomonadota bacterium]